jgi:hypothetical protein
MPRRFVLVGLVVGALAAAAPAEEEFLRLAPTDADLSVKRRDWFGVYVGGKKIGWFHEDFGRAGTGPDAVYVVSSSGLLAIEASGQQVEVQIEEREEFDATAPFALRAARTETKEADGSEIIEVTRDKGAYSATVTAGGDTRTLEVPALDYTLADAMTPELWIRAGRAPGDTARVRDFNTSALKPDSTTFKVTAVKESLVSGVRTKFHEVSMTTALRASEASATFDAQGRAISGKIGGAFEIRAEPEEQAMRIEKGGDLFVRGMARIDRPVGDPLRVTKLVVGVRGEALDKIPAGPRQSVARAADGRSITLSLGEGQGATETATAGEIADALAETVSFPTKLPKVVELAAQAVGDAKTQKEKVERLVHFVSSYVEDVLLPRDPSVSELITSRKGDCTEHARLFVTLARAAGIPAREVGGLMYMGDDAQAFGGHAWNEVVLDGVWVPVDPTWDQTTLDAAHIALERNQTGMGFLATMGSLKLELREVALLPPKAPAK